MNSNSKLDFLCGIESNKVSMSELVKKHKLWKGNSYDQLTKINARSENRPIPSKDILKIYKSIYDAWYEYIKNLNLGKFSSEQKLRIQNFLAMSEYKKENMTPQSCYKFMHGDYDKFLKGCGIRPTQIQSGNYGIIAKNGAIYPDFIHCMPFEKPSDISCRLYLNMQPENISLLCEKLMKKCYEKRNRVYFKFWTNDNRNDTFLIYTNYKQAQTFINILKEIRTENPKIFEGCEKMNPLLTNLEGFIGFGEEPVYKHASFNEERAEAIDEFSKDVIDKEIVEERKRIGNYSSTVITSEGAELGLEEYLVYRLERSFKETVMHHQRNIANRQFPRYYVEHGEDSIRAYIEIQNKIYRSCMNTLPAFVENQIRTEASRYLEGLRRGENVYIKHIVFPTENSNLFPSRNNDLIRQELQSRGYLSYTFKIDINMQEKLFSVFNSDNVIESLITDEALKPYLEKHHVATTNLSLNLETESLVPFQVVSRY